MCLGTENEAITGRCCKPVVRPLILTFDLEVTCQIMILSPVRELDELDGHTENRIDVLSDRGEVG